MHHFPVVRQTFATSLNHLRKKMPPDPTVGAPASEPPLRHNDARFFALQFRSGREPAAKKFNVAAGPRTAVRSQQPHTKKEDEQSEHFGVFYWRCPQPL